MALDAGSRTPDDRPMTELRALVLQVHDSGVSYEDMAVRARRKGFDIGKSYFNEVALGRIRLPKDERLAALAAGLPGVTEPQVREAAARSANIHVEHNINYQMSSLLALVQEMSSPSRERWYRLATVIAKELAAEDTAPPTTVVLADDRPQGPHTRRVLERGFDEVTARTPPQARRQRPE